jgi:hypothetical protein
MLRSPRISKRFVHSPSCERRNTFQQLAGITVLDLHGALHIGANIGWRQYFCLAQIFGMSVGFFAALAKSAKKLKTPGKHDILMAMSERMNTDIGNIGEVAKVSNRSFKQKLIAKVGSNS